MSNTSDDGGLLNTSFETDTWRRFNVAVYAGWAIGNLKQGTWLDGEA
jgi:hypothetical protein